MSKYQKRISVGSFLIKGDDFKHGDLLEVANEGKESPSNYTNDDGSVKMQNLFLLKTKDGKEGNVAFNQTTINGLIDAFGDDSVNWVGKKIKAHMIKQNVSGRFLNVWYFSHPEAELTEDGFVMPEGKNTSKSVGDNDIPIIEDDINPKDIPF